ncbi:glycine cleavage system protein GcvH [Maridesulfovibrio sp.]|uniref:glycine cleavage system protein GcvH n=1 Tax=Maridesulfovibrio sp. TaxID=2795000 RepID=UPI0029CA718E|nr:glycine cleavage system protein GcvH [Maridesulfovibrio sp.]
MIPQELLYSKSHEWLKVDGENGVIGITHFAQEQLGDLTFVELPQEGDTFAAGDEFGSIESVKAASEMYAPVDCEVIAVNEALEDAPEKVNEDPYGEGWLVKVKITGPTDALLDAAAYEKVTEEEAH